MSRSLPITVVLGGGIAGLEATMALADLARGRTDLMLVTPDPDFQLKPMVVEEPFTSEPADRRELAPVADALDAELIRGSVSEVIAGAQVVMLDDGRNLHYDFLIVCIGGHARGVYSGATTLRAAGEAIGIDRLLATAAEHGSRRLALVVPPGVGWTLPLYEIALMSRRRAEELGLTDLKISFNTPELAPLVVFGSVPSDAVAEMLQARKIDFHGNVYVREADSGDLFTTPDDIPVDAGATIALPVVEGPLLAGLPHDDRGFIPVDEHARVPDADRVYAAGDASTFPIKQGGLGTQQADAAAEHIARELGADLQPSPFHPVLRGKLIVGGESLDLRQDLTGGHGEGVASPDYLWWPPQKVSGRYLSAWLADEPVRAEPEPSPSRSLEIEVALPHEWHRDPMALDPYGSPSVD
jgi:sulfide:quinone oxidoreductase